MEDELLRAFRKLTDAVNAILQAHLTTTTMSIRQIETEHRAFLETIRQLTTDNERLTSFEPHRGGSQ